jgi:hypothetical protein
VSSDKVGGVLAAVDDQAVLVEGHTDDVPIGEAVRPRVPGSRRGLSARDGGAPA